MTAPTARDPRRELLGRMSTLEARVAELVANEPNHPAGENPMRGLYFSHAQAITLLAGGAAGATVVAESPPRDEAILDQISARCGLDDTDVDILVAALAPDLDSRFEKLYGFIHDDLTKLRPTIGLVMRLCGLQPTDAGARARFGPAGPLRTHALLIVEDEERPFLSRTLRVPDQVPSVLLGGDALEPILQRVMVERVRVNAAEQEPVRDAIERGRFVHLTEGIGGAAAHIAAAAIRACHEQPLLVDVSAAPVDDLATIIAAVVRHRALTGDIAVIRPIESIAEHAPRAMAQLAQTNAAVMVGSKTWDPAWASVIPQTIAIGELPQAEIGSIWERGLAKGDVEPDAIDAMRRAFRLTPEQITRAARAALLTVGSRQRSHEVDFAALSAAARAQSSSGLDRLARRIEPSASWDDLILPPDVAGRLHELALRVRWREQVMHDWKLGRAWRGRGIAALFAGPSGTGKTTAAEVIGGELGFDIHVVDLSTVVDKYIGETEKKLEVVFTEAERTNTVLLFDEADAIFGKRSEVKDARDRYANVEVSYLLQRIERFTGLAILTTNLGANLDEAFTRRLDSVIDFPRPDAAARKRLWQHELRPSVPTADIDLDYCATSFDVTGGDIRNIVVTAAYLASEARGPVTMTEIVAAVQREYRKLGRLCITSEFGKFAHLLDRG
ncbi:MAG TPA: ATP-binding protein [Ilumatobacteraceae bacterium]